MAGINEKTNERGAALVSYVVLIAVIAMVAMVSLTRVGRTVDDQFTETGEALRAAPVSVVEGDDPSSDAADDDADADSVSGDDEGGDAGGDAEQPGDTTGGSGGSGGSSGDAAGPTGGGSGGSDGGATTTTTTVATTTTTTIAATTTTTTTPENVDGPDPSVDEEDLVSATASYRGQFAVVFNVIDGSVVIGSVASPGWRYAIVKERDQRLHLEFTKYETGETVLVKGWVNAHGVLKTKVQD